MRLLNYALTFMLVLTVSKETINAQGKPAPLPLMIPPSPNAAALGDYGKVPVGLFTGTIQQNIPLYTIQASELSIPISLSYQSNGLRVSDIGSNVGLGWVLDAGGVVTRTVNDETDEYSSSRISVPLVGVDSPEMSTFLKQATSDNTLDGEPDLFSFNFGSYSGKFYITGTAPNMQAVLINPSPVKIEFLPDFYTATVNTVQIKITDPQGIIYEFGGANAVEKSNSRAYGDGGSADNPQSKTIKTAWNLTKIILQNADVINYVYARQVLNYDVGISQTVSSTLRAHPTTGITYLKAVHALPKVTNVNTQGSKLTEINWRNGQINFSYSPRFAGSAVFEKVDNLLISAKNNTTVTPIQKYVFSYSTFDGTYNNPDNFNGSDIDAGKRLFLTALISQSPAGTELNRHSFEYHNPDQLPHRLSYAQDYWGYFNGQANRDLVTNDVSLYNPGYYQVTGVFSKETIYFSFQDVGGDKNAYGDYAVKGTLKKVTYPTGGSSSFEYEAHTTGKIETVYPSTKQRIKLSKNIPAASGDVTTFTTGIIPFDQNRIEITPILSGVGCANNSQQRVEFEASVKEVQSNTNVPIEIFDGSAYTPYSPAMILYNDVYVNQPRRRYFVTLKQGKSYTFSIGLTAFTCSSARGEIRLDYYSENTTQQWVNRPVGGVRIKKITTEDLTGNQQIKRYYYGNDLSCLTCSSGRIRGVEPGISYYESLLLTGGNLEERTLIANLSSTPLNDLYNAQGYHISYNTVIEGSGENLEGGVIVHRFSSLPEIAPIKYKDPIIGTPYSNVFGNGEELITSYYKKENNNFIRVKEIYNDYSTDNRRSNFINGFKATKRTFSYQNSVETYNLCTYIINSQWRYLFATREVTYDQSGGNGSTIYTNYTYGNPLHLQPTVISKIVLNPGASSQRMLSTIMQYPQDYTFPGTLTETASAIKAMVTKNMLTLPIEQKTMSVTGSVSNVIEASLSTYKMNGTSVVKDTDYQLKSSNNGINQDVINFTNSSINSSGQFIYDLNYEPLNSYNVFDSKNNLLEAKDRKNTISLIRDSNTDAVWAKVTNSTYNNAAYTSFENNGSSNSTNWNYAAGGIISTTYFNGAKAYRLLGGPIVSTQALTTSVKYKVSLWRRIGGTIFIIKNGTTTLITKAGAQRNGWEYVEIIVTGNNSKITIQGNFTIDELRLCPLNARMTTYTYKDGVGISSECNENNQITFYEYDEFNRLKLIRDQDKNIIKKNEYKYQHIQN